MGLIPVPVLDGMPDVVRLRLQYHAEAVSGVWPNPWLPPHPVDGVPLRKLGDFDRERYEREQAPEYARRAERSFDAAVAFARRWRPHLVLHDPASLEGLLAARVQDVPAALCLWGPVGTHEREHMRIVPTDHSGAFARYGLGDFTLEMIDTVIDPCPAGLSPPTTARRLPVRYVPYNGCGPLPPWLTRPPNRPRLCVTWSTALSTMSGPRANALPELVRALDGLGHQVVVTATRQDAAALRGIPPTVRVLEQVPLRLLLPGCAAVAHHGGSGSTMTSVWAGTPQLALTFASEQAVAGERVAGTGAGVHIPGGYADPDALRAAMRRLTEEASFVQAAAALRADLLDRPSPARLVMTLEELAAA
ncbi:nucleotide disphospho-sugar-binding domain-containing protein [Streptomyces griseus]|uniref:nucleotide disphospho-sugar-binding domain-containing protein n=1 Tax=Streptomyces griseus TaxID=1911 RepID=UPI0018FE8695|nr:nucleotide disphospho-sugar-binding domain-containing protein [Streptomyces griseus]